MRYSVSRKGYSHKGKETHLCKKCGEDNPKNFYGKKKTECKSCFNKRCAEQRRKVKLQAIEHLGGKCERCGYDKFYGALEFHHRDPKEKDFTIAGKNSSWKRIKNEIEKCALLCANCHREVHAEERKG